MTPEFCPLCSTAKPCTQSFESRKGISVNICDECSHTLQVLIHSPGYRDPNTENRLVRMARDKLERHTRLAVEGAVKYAQRHWAKESE